ncbi:MAG: gamma carbonic anhydrase family protein [Planctomycetota bacterium]
MHSFVLSHGGKTPRFGADVFVAPTAAIVGDVLLGARVSVWYAAVLRGDVHRIEIGDDTNIQDGVVVHGTLDEWPVVIGARVSIGHSATVHGATIEDDALVGIGARVLDGARIGAFSLVAAGAVVREGMIVPPRSLVVGVPAVVRRSVTDREIEIIRRTPERYRALAAAARAEIARVRPG